ncbi:Tfp pilus assembly protein PilF [Humitalea rosea]|uniref:Tfp pilus assembly protein PilF n=1 Tax=Humitalea rosea TaxID=990373 RepID=A0A2W7IE48_9PROT|nr:cellulose biosynthesis protein BcsC [Humitalea rosea]PZW44934.1 Tfp pilus assembly protein PilF [Humitalea rosea]
MTMRTRLLASVFAAALLPFLPGSAPAQQQTDPAIAALLDQANYWRLQNKPEQAIRALERVLAADPRNVEGLAAAAASSAEAGNRAAADQYLRRLRQIAPNDPRLARTDLAVQGASLDPAGLDEARRLARAGNNAAAAQRFRELFRGNVPPPNVAVEYYQTLAGTEAGYAEAQRGLARLAAENPNDRRIQLAYSQMLTFREGTRSVGVERLRALAQTPDAGQASVASWRDALIWSGPNPQMIPEFRAFLQRFPNDQQVQGLLAQAMNPPQGPADAQGEARSRGFTAYNGGRLPEAEREFQAALTLNPQDSDALGGLGLVRSRQGRTREARSLLQQAIDADPTDGRRKWGAALAGTNATGGGGNARASGGDVNQARSLLLRGDVDESEQALLRIVRRDGGDRADAEALLGDIALRRGDPVAAEQRYRAALSRRPALPTALAGLYDSLQQLGRFAEAEQLLQGRNGAALTAAAGTQRAESLRAEATRTDDPEAALALLRAAVAANPADPWTRLDAARLLSRQGRGAEGRALIEEPLAAGRPSNEALQAAALFANEEGRVQDAAALIERIPNRVRTADQTMLLRRARIQQQVAAAAAPGSMGDRTTARTRLLSLATRPDPTGEVPAAVVRALMGLNDPQGAVEAARVAASVNRRAPVSGRIAVADALLDAGLTYEAAVLAQGVAQDSRLTSDERRRVNSLMAGVAVRESDRLNQQGNQAAAYERLAPALVQDPTNPSANLALARLYQGADEPRDAQRIAEAVLQRDPRNTDARQAAMDAAVALRDWGRAEALLAEGRALLPNDPRISMLEARLARSWGDTRRAQVALEQAATQRRNQLGVNQPIGSYAPAIPTAPQPAGLYDNPFRRTPLAGQDQPMPPVWAAQPERGERAVRAAPTPAPAPAPAPAPRQYAQAYQPPAASPQYPAAAPQYAAPQYAAPPQYSQPYASPGGPAAPAVDQRYVRPAQYAAPPQSPTPFRLMPSGGVQTPVTSDPLLNDISRQLTEVREEAAPRLSASFGGRARSGDAGLDRLTEFGGTAEASTSMPGIGGRIIARVSPVSINAGDLASDVPTLRRYGSNVLQLPGGLNPAITTAQARATQPGDGSASGVGLGVAYVRDNFSLDVGSTPIGFERQNIVGGIEVAPSLAQGVRLRLTGERRAVTDSLLSWAGMRDSSTNKTWGGVVRTSGRAAIELTEGDTEFYALGGYGTLEGENVADNSRVEAGAGFRTPIYRTARDELVAGLDLTYMAYDQNLRLFTLGHGGYFSPQSFFSATVPVDYRARTGNFFWRVGASAGFSTFREDRAALFPDDASLQRQVEQRAASDSTISAFYPGQTQSGFAGGLRGDIEYAVSPALRLGALARYDRSGDWNEGRAMVFARYRLGGQ